MYKDEESTKAQNARIKAFAEAHGLEWNANVPHLVSVTSESGERVDVDLSATDPKYFSLMVIKSIVYREVAG